MRVFPALRLLLWHRLPPLLAAGVIMLVSGCLRVVRQQAPYYLKGPHQVEPPDGFLEPGTHVLTFGSKDTYSHVLTFDGIAADVWDGDLATLGEWRRQQQARKSADSGAGAPASAAPR